MYTREATWNALHVRVQHLATTRWLPFYKSNASHSKLHFNEGVNEVPSEYRREYRRGA